MAKPLGRPRKPTGGKRPGAGRKRLPIDLKTVEQLAAIGCTNDEIATVVGCSKDTFERRKTSDKVLAEAVRNGRLKGLVTLRRAQWKGAVTAGNPTMLIWLGKQMLGQRDQHVVTVKEEAEPDFSVLTVEQLGILRQAAQIMKQAQGIAAAPLLEHAPVGDSSDDADSHEAA